MSEAEILKQLKGIFIDVLDNENIVLKHETVAEDVQEWDSLTHILLIGSVEKHFKIKFTAAEVQGLRNVGHLCDGIQRKLAHESKP